MNISGPSIIPYAHAGYEAQSVLRQSSFRLCARMIRRRKTTSLGCGFSGEGNAWLSAAGGA